ncbi:MerR family transcriptional regulator [Microbacterium sp. HD4P20]|uniref:MerR family transcriptional regulator n=1 Tax=Microbacterium sp. HD4P20 TaxID=2864874 RepID=UPI001C64115E|nr:MerR family transcriptional regulator [Microbacterium sp. HD4P20]MCP2636071.1 MerR family transcriptional regulator [Microbacterium sp. HD4P20]
MNTGEATVPRTRASILHIRGKKVASGGVDRGVQIGEAARVTGATARSLRFYEEEGLIQPGRCANGYRDYCAATVDRVLVVRSLLESGLPTALIQRMLCDPTGSTQPATRLPDALRAEVQLYRERVAARVARLTAQLSALDDLLVGGGEVERHG